MSHSEYNAGIPANCPGKKPYVAMKVSNLGAFSDLTQQMSGGAYSDMMAGLMVMMRRRR
jgi:hypothetical protein